MSDKAPTQLLGRCGASERSGGGWSMPGSHYNRSAVIMTGHCYAIAVTAAAAAAAWCVVVVMVRT